MQSAAMSHPYTDIIVVFIGYMNGHEWWWLLRFHESIDVEHVNRCRINEDSRSLGSIHLPSSCTFTPFTWTALHDPTVSLSILYARKYILHEFTCPHLVKIWSAETPKGQSGCHYCVHGSTFCRTPNRDQKRPLLWREHRHTSKMVTNMVVVYSTVTL